MAQRWSRKKIATTDYLVFSSMMESNFQIFQTLQFWKRNVQNFIVQNIRSLEEKKMGIIYQPHCYCMMSKGAISSPHGTFTWL